MMQSLHLIVPLHLRFFYMLRVVHFMRLLNSGRHVLLITSLRLMSKDSPNLFHFLRKRVAILKMRFLGQTLWGTLIMRNTHTCMHEAVQSQYQLAVIMSF